MAFFLEDVGPKDEGANDGGSGGDDEYGAGSGVFGLTSQGVTGRGGEVGEALDGGVNQFGRDDTCDAKRHDAPLRATDAKPPTG